MHRLWSLLRRWLSILYFIAIALMVVGALLFLAPGLKGSIWQTIGGVLVGTGFTMLVTTITSQQSIHEQYKKEANLQRKEAVSALDRDYWRGFSTVLLHVSLYPAHVFLLAHFQEQLPR